MLGYGIIRTDRRFSGSFEDALFGVFVADSALTTIIDVIDMIPTPRWRDYIMRIQLVTDSIVLTGEGATYGDVPIRRAYEWQPWPG